jgi:hypothetical protein
MQDHRSALPLLWISETDEHGKRVNREVIETAHRIWSRVLQHLRRAGQDLAPAAEILEATCHSVSRAIRRSPLRNPVRNLDSYLLWAFIRKYNRRMVREGRIQYVESLESLENARVEPDHNWVSMLEDEIQLKQLLSYLDPRTRDMLMHRVSGDSWAEVGKHFSISPHNAEVQFANGIKKARGRLLGEGSERIRRGKR